MAAAASAPRISSAMGFDRLVKSYDKLDSKRVQGSARSRQCFRFPLLSLPLFPFYLRLARSLARSIFVSSRVIGIRDGCISGVDRIRARIFRSSARIWEVDDSVCRAFDLFCYWCFGN